MRPCLTGCLRRVLLLLALLSGILSGIVSVHAYATVASASTPSSAPALVLKGRIAMTRLEPFVSYRCDTDSRLPLSAIKQLGLLPLPHHAISLGQLSGACWFHFSLSNESTDAQTLLLRIDNPVLDDIQLFTADDAAAPPIQLGDGLPFNNRPIATRAFTIPLVLSAGTTQDYYLRVSSSSSINVPLQIGSPIHFVGDHELEEWLHGAGFGIAGGILIYHLFLWLVVREKVYRFYVLYAAAAFGYLLCFKGIGYRLWPEQPTWNGHAQLLFIFLMFMAGPLFARDFLNTRTKTWPDRSLLFASALSGLALTAQFFLPLALGYRLQPLIAILIISTIAATALGQWRKGMREARLFLISWGMLLLLGLLLALHSIGLTPALPFPLTLNAMEVGFVLQQLLLSLALANRLSTLKREQGIQQQSILRAEAENAAKSEFLAKMSHEIRTPMNALMGITQLLQDTPLNHNQKGYVDTLHRSGHALLHVINDILDYSKITAGKITLESTDFDLPSLVDDCIQVFNLAAQEKSLSLHCHIGDDIPRSLRGDPNRLRQVLLNLLSNAIKFTAHGSVQLQIKRQSSFADGRVRLEFAVSDTGIGIAPEKVEVLFDWFTQADSSTAREYGGTGLGLTISQQLVNLMGGNIRVDSQPEQGARFSFSIVLSPASSPLQALAASPDTLPGISRLRVLVVEDNPINQMVIVGLLRKLGIQPRMAASGAEALDAVRESHDAFDLVLMDCEMPIMDGYQTTRAIRALEAHLNLTALPIVALTAHALPEHREACLAAGMTDYLTKPLMLSALTRMLLLQVPAETTSMSSS
jgi:signal transduction histidine kinase/CheY-like chemotaxis protein